MNKTISFQEACNAIRAADFVLLDDEVYRTDRVTIHQETALVLKADRPPEGGDPDLYVWLRPEDHPHVEVLHNGALRMREEGGEQAMILPCHVHNLGVTTAWCSADIAAALMDAMHTEVTRQQVGSDSAYEELVDAARSIGLDIPDVWSWIASMANAAHTEMVPSWLAADGKFADHMQPAAQGLHNYVTDPTVWKHQPLNPIPQARCEELWREAHQAVLDHAKALEAEQRAREEGGEMREFLCRLIDSTKTPAGYSVGNFIPSNGDHAIRYEAYGGPPLMLRKSAAGAWYCEADARTESPTPVEAFRIYQKLQALDAKTTNSQA